MERDWKTEKKELEGAFDIISDKLVKAEAEIRLFKQLIFELTAWIDKRKNRIHPTDPIHRTLEEVGKVS